MKAPFVLFLFLLRFVDTSCEGKTAYLIPVIPDQNTSFKVNGQRKVPNGVAENALTNTRPEVDLARGRSKLYPQRPSSDRQTTLRIRAEDLPLRKLGKRDGSNWLGTHPRNDHGYLRGPGGKHLLPHVEAVSSMSYSVVLCFPPLPKTVVCRGLSMPAQPVIQLKFLNGTFDLIVEIRD